MYDISYGYKRKDYIFGGFFFFIGLLFFVIFFWITFGGMIKKLKYDSSIKATKINQNSHYSGGSYMYSPIYYYTVDGKHYSCNDGSVSNINNDASQNMVYYDSKNPTDCITDYTVKPKIYMYFICLFTLVFVLFGFLELRKVYKKIKKIKHLVKYGILVQNIEYKMKTTGIATEKGTLCSLAVDYKSETGSIIHLVSESRFDCENFDKEGYIDLLIDPNDVSNYYIDFNITKKY